MNRKTRRLQLAALLVAPVILTAAICGSPDDDAAVDEGSEPSLTAVATTEGSPSDAIPTPLDGLTDTGYLAPSGQPLFAECIADGLTLPPPAYPELVEATEVPLENQADAIEPTFEGPSYDWSELQPADTAAWPTILGACYGFAMSLPGSLEIDQELAPIGYGLGEAFAGRIDGQAIVSVQMVSSSADMFAEPASTSTENLGVIVAGETTSIGGRPARFYSNWEREPIEGDDRSAVTYRYVVAVGKDLWLWVNILLFEPYDGKTAAELRAIVESIRFPE